MGQSEHIGEVAHEVRRVIEPAVAAAGLYLESVRLKGAGVTQVVQVIVDLPDTEIGSLGSDQLGEVSRAISKALDADDVVPGSYALEVSTPGATRTMRTAREFRRARTRLVWVELNDGKELTGRLVAVTGGDDDAVLEFNLKGQKKLIALADVKKGKVELEMNRVAEAVFADDDTHGDDDFDDEEDESV